MGGRTGKMGGGMMMKRPMMQEGGEIKPPKDPNRKRPKALRDLKEDPMRDRKKQPLKRKNFKDMDPDRKFLKQKQGVKFFEAKAGGMARRMGKKKPVLSEEGKRKIKSRMTGGDSTGILFPDVYKVKKMGGGRIKKKMGGSLKPVDPKTQKGLSKLPTEVRNKMGYMKKGGKVHGK